MPSLADTVLLTGFEPFGGESVNPSAMIAEALHGELVRGYRIESVVLPVTFADAPAQLANAMEQLRPRLVVCLGQAGGEAAVCIERIAINLQDAGIPDNHGAQPRDVAIAPDGPAAYWSLLPVARIVSAIAKADIPVRASNSAGTFVCNHIFYGLMRALAAETGVRGGFVHVPFLPEQAEANASACMALEMMVEAIRIAVDTSV